MPEMMTLKKEDINTPEKREKYTLSVIGCGRIGLSHACLFAEAGFKVIAVDANQRTINLIKKGKTPFMEPRLDVLLERHIKNGRLTATQDTREAASASDIIVFVVPTLIDRRKKPDYSAIEKACKDVGMELRPGSMIIFASATGPGVTESLVKETLENTSGLKAGIDFGLAYSPIHAIPGRVLQDITTYVRVVGAVDEQSLRTGCLVLGTIVTGEIVKVKNIKTVEAVKVFESVYQDINLALANSFALFCEKAGIDIVEAQKVASRQPNCHLPTPEIVNEYIIKDHYLLVEESETLNVKLPMVTLARKINDEMLGHTVRLVRDALRACGKNMRRAKVSIFGIACRPNVKVADGSQAKRFINMLNKKGMVVRVYDPLFSYKELTEMGYPIERTLKKTVEKADCLVIAVGHDRFRRLNLGKIKFLVKKPAAIIDMGRVIDPVKAEKEGFVYRGVGRGVWAE
ncbi:nucleotide sugar dehydrogenase [Candidatus Bathyarchaeota archaeon]|nr:nucleotide sugar dehydrogenase [Candidatus Bathyarchaeota archaeon]